MKKLFVLFTILVLSILTLGACAQQPPIKYNVKFLIAGGEIYHEITVDSGTLINLPEAPTKDGVSFAGWFSDGNLYDSNPFPVGQNIILTARWNASLNLYDGLDLIETKTYLAGNSIGLLSAPAKDGYSFDFWALDALGENPVTWPLTLNINTNIYAFYQAV
ncbi:MAG: InlB B-repeat-containing protein [Acholeplasmatales bacterium]|jgi:hypothetical protein|nr:InlB B-repeat-containing protein [Acholeplasmatales bacterium]